MEDGADQFGSKAGKTGHSVCSSCSEEEQDYRSGVINVLFHVLRSHAADQVFQDGS